MDLIFFGMQGSGKGTLGKAVAEKFNLKIFETGGELRRLAKEDSELGRKIKSIIEAGHLVPNEVVMEIVENFIENELSGDQAVLFDGIPRAVEQAESLNALLDKHQRQYTGVLLKIAKQTALYRLTHRRICSITGKVYPATYKGDKSEAGGELITRKDDNPEAIETRLNTFFEKTVPAIETYQNLIEINGEPAIEEVREEAFEKLSPLYGN
jgi:adenylate kinase